MRRAWLTKVLCFYPFLFALCLTGCGSSSSAPTTAELIQTIVSTPNRAERTDAARQLAEALDPGAVAKLVRLADTNPGAARGVEIVLDRLGALYGTNSGARKAQRRARVVASLAPIDDRRAAAIAVLALRKDEDKAVREDAVRSLARMKRSARPFLASQPTGAQINVAFQLDKLRSRDPKAVKGLWPPLVKDLIAELRTGNTFRAAGALAAIGGPAVQPLIALAETPFEGKSQDEQIGISEAQNVLGQIAAENLRAVKPLLDALRERDYAQIARLPNFYVALGKPGSEPILGDAVADQYVLGGANPGLPFIFLGSGNPKLESEVKAALEGKGYTVTGSSGGIGPQWGSSGAF